MNNKPKVELDANLEFEQIKQFASQIKHIPNELIKGLEEGFNGTRSMDFYRGLIAGLTNAYLAATNEEFVKKNQVEGAIFAMLTFASSKFKDKIE